MKILHVYKTYLPDDFTGVPRVIHALAEGMAPHDVQTSVLTVGTRQQGEQVRVGSHRVHVARKDLKLASSEFSLSAFGLFRKLVREADLVNYHFPWPFADLLHFSCAHSVPSVVTYHSDIVRQRRLAKIYAPLQNRFLASVDSIVATSPNYVQTSSVLKKFSEKTSVIPIGLPDEQVQGAAVEAWRSVVGTGFFLFVGALRYYKGLSYLVEAARLTGLPVVIAGEGDPKSLGTHIPPNVKILGAVKESDKLALLKLCHAFVFPSHLRSEAFGISLLEAARAGKAMISTEIGTGTSFVNLHGQTGLVVAPADAPALATAMRNLAGHAEMTEKMGLAARQRYLEYFQQETMAQSYMRLYRQLLHRG